MLNKNNKRLPHAVLNLESRYLKAKKIECLLNLNSKSELSVLEVGVGSGGISYYFAKVSKGQYKVTAVDVVDSRLIFDGYDFHLVDGVALPFDSETFDVVISNHVIEHVGELDAQMSHLRELGRVLKKTGVGYLAVPNRWMLFEPHYKLIFLSWLPKKFRSPYLRVARKGSYYDCEPLQKHEVEDMFNKTNFLYKNLCVDALRLTFELEKQNSVAARFLRCVPNFLLDPLTPIIPTLIYSIKKSEI